MAIAKQNLHPRKIHPYESKVDSIASVKSGRSWSNEWGQRGLTAEDGNSREIA